MDGDIDALRADTSGIDDLGLTEITDDYYDQITTGLDRQPIIMGHSFGGLVTQLLLDRGLGSAGVAIDSSPIKGVLALPASTLRSGFPVLKNPANRHRSVSLTPEEFHHAFTNTLTDAESLDAYQRYTAPGPGRVLFQGALANFSHHSPEVDVHNDERAPLLIITGGVDHVYPPKIGEANAKRVPRPIAFHPRAARLGGRRRLRHRLGAGPHRERQVRVIRPRLPRPSRATCDERDEPQM